MMMIWPLCRLCSIANNVSEVNEDGPVGGVGVGTGASRRRREILRKIIMFVSNKKIYNERVQTTLQLSKPRIQSF